MIYRHHNLIAILVVLTLSMVTSAKGLQPSMVCADRICCCSGESLGHMSAVPSKACHGSGPCCQVQSDLPLNDLDMATSLSIDGSLAAPNSAKTTQTIQAAVHFRIQENRWRPPQVSAIPIYYQTGALLF
jgi:hypothetical protein